MEDVELNSGGGKFEGKLYLERLLHEGKHTPIATVAAEDIKVPPWYDRKKYQRAIAIIARNNFSVLLSSLLGLIMVLAIETILQILVCTRQSGTPKTAYRRYLRTVFHTFNFYEYLPENDSKCIKSIVDVRLRHERSSKMAHKKNVGFINQRDMAITQFGFMGFLLMRHQRLGLRGTPEDLDAIVHVWRVLGHMLGIEDQYNLCTDTYEGTVERVTEMFHHVVTPVMIKPPQRHFHEMVDVMLSGLWSYVPLITTPSFLFLTKVMAGVPGCFYSEEDRVEQLAYVKGFGSYVANAGQVEKELKGQQKCAEYAALGWWDRFVINFVFYTTHLCYVSVLWRLFFKSQIHLARFLITWFPFLAFHRFGFRASYVRILTGTGQPSSEDDHDPVP